MSSIISSPVFETVLSIVLILAMLSMLVSAITEILNSYFQERGKQLYRCITRIFDDGKNENFGISLYRHPMISSIRKDPKSLPQYISDFMFSQVIIEIIGNYRTAQMPDGQVAATPLSETNPFLRFKEGVARMETTPLKSMLQNMADKSEALSSPASDVPLAILEKQLKQWYNDQMDRMTGWYKHSIRTRLRWVAFAVTLGMNVNGIHVFQTIFRSPELRSELSQSAGKVAENYGRIKNDTTINELKKQLRSVSASSLKKMPDDTGALSVSRTVLTNLHQYDLLTDKLDSERVAMIRQANDRIDELEAFELPIGWETDEPPLNWMICLKNKIQKKDSVCRYSCLTGSDTTGSVQLTDYFLQYRRCTPMNVLVYIAGILLTTFAISLGAPFWFDLLLKFVNVRKAGTKPSGSVD